MFSLRPWQVLAADVVMAVMMAMMMTTMIKETMMVRVDFITFHYVSS